METFATDAAPGSATAAGPVRLEFEFRGSAAEYFRIWVVNLALTVVTLGVYSAWAKVRRLKYLHGHTWLAGSAFGYHADPLKILKGRAIGLLLLIAYVAAGRFNPTAGTIAGAALGFAMPWLVVKSLKFRLRMTSWRGLRFDFDEAFAEAYRIYLGWGTLAVLSLGLLMPHFLRKLHQFTVARSAYGTTYFECDPPLRPIYVAMVKATLFGLVVGVGLLLGFAVIVGMSAVAGPPAAQPSPLLQLLPLAIAVFVYLGAYAIFNAGLLNAVYGNTTLGPHRLHSDLRGGRLAWIYVSNVLAIVASLGLLVPWATVRVLRYRLSTLAVSTTGSLDDFVAAQGQANPDATGEEVADLFDVDFGL
jgi:uncharacterized membrane protein YjgN (DUF898 family)